ncbi:acetate--CoA ligase family protein [Jatrophihabitans fulvus]
MSDGVDLSRLYSPRRMAVVGAHDAKPPFDFMTAQLEARARAVGGEFIPVNPTRETVMGYATVADASALPDELDVVVVLIAQVKDVLLALAGKRVAFVVVHASGWSELGTDEGRAAEREIVQLAHGLGARMVGPNTNMNLFEVLAPSDAPRIGVVAQSGHQGRPIVSAQALGMGVSYWITTGNEADLRAADFIEFMAGTPETGAVAAYIEGFRSGEGLRRAAAACITEQTPLIVVKVGRSAQGAAAALSHTGQLAGADETLTAFFEQNAVHRVVDLDELQEVASAVARVGVLPEADGVAVCSASGGCNAHLVDLITDSGLTAPELSEKTQDRLRELLGPNLSVVNPVDNGGRSLLLGKGPEMIDAIMDDPAVGVVLLPVSTPLPAMAQPIRDTALHAFRRGDKPVIALSLMPSTDDPVFRDLAAAGVPVVRNMRNAISAAKAILNHPGRRFPDGPMPGLTDVVVRDRGEGRLLDEAASLQWLAERGLRPVEHRVAADADEAAEAAAAIGYPVVAKAVVPGLAHKSDAGGVVVDIRDEAALRAVIDDFGRRFGSPGLDGVLVEEFLQGGVELLLGISTDPLLGPAVVVGAGGVDAEALRDTALSVVPFDRARAEHMVDSLRVSRLLAPWRGRPALDRDAVVDALMALETIARSGDVAELDINPLLVLPDGVRMLDAVVALNDPL